MWEMSSHLPVTHYVLNTPGVVFGCGPGPLPGNGGRMGVIIEGTCRRVKGGPTTAWILQIAE